MLRFYPHFSQRLILFFLLTLLPLPMMQGAYLDSLRALLPQASPKEKLELLQRLAEGMTRSSVDSALIYGHQALNLAEALEKKKDIAVGYILLGRIHEAKGNFILATDYLIKGLDRAEELEDKRLAQHIRASLGLIYTKRGKYEEALQHFNATLRFWEKMNDGKREATMLLNLGYLYRDQKHYGRSAVYLRKALHLAQKMDSKRTESLALHNLGMTFEQQGFYDSALVYLNRSLVIKKDRKYTIPMVETLAEIGKVYTYQQNFDEAADFFQQALEIAEAEGRMALVVDIWRGMGKLEAARKQYQEAIRYYRQSQEMAHHLGLVQEEMELYLQLAEAEAQAGHYPEGFAAHARYNFLRDSLNEVRNRRQMAELEIKYELDAKEAEIAELRQEEKLNQQRTLMLLLLAGVFVLALIALYLRFRGKQRLNQVLARRNREVGERNRLLASKNEEIDAQNRLLELQSQAIHSQNQQLRQSNSDLEQFAYAVSHDFREPLRTIRSYLQLFSLRYSKNIHPEGMEFLNFASNGANHMDRLLGDLLIYSRIGRTDKEFSEVDLDQTVSQVAENLHSQIKDAQGKLVTGQLPVIKGYASEIYLMLQNLISNAIKFHRPDVPPVVEVSAAQKDRYWDIQVKDNGIGIKPDHQTRIFQIFHRLHTRDHYDGTGIGLAMCEKIVRNHGGSIEVDSQEGQGSTFHIYLPFEPFQAARPQELMVSNSQLA